MCAAQRQRAPRGEMMNSRLGEFEKDDEPRFELGGRRLGK